MKSRDRVLVGRDSEEGTVPWVVRVVVTSSDKHSNETEQLIDNRNN